MDRFPASLFLTASGFALALATAIFAGLLAASLISLATLI